MYLSQGDFSEVGFVSQAMPKRNKTLVGIERTLIQGPFVSIANKKRTSLYHTDRGTFFSIGDPNGTRTHIATVKG